MSKQKGYRTNSTPGAGRRDEDGRRLQDRTHSAQNSPFSSASQNCDRGVSDSNYEEKVNYGGQPR